MREDLARDFCDWVEECWPVTAKRLPTPVLYRRLVHDFERAKLEAYREAASLANDIAEKNVGYSDGPGALRVANAISEFSETIGAK